MVTTPLRPRRSRPAATLAAAALLAGAGLVHAQTVAFSDIPHGFSFYDNESVLAGRVSADGSAIAIGRIDSMGIPHSYRYAAGALTAVPGACNNYPEVSMPVISADGNSLGGFMHTCPPNRPGLGLWRAGQGTTFLGMLPGGVTWFSGEPGTITAMSADGSVAVGYTNGVGDPEDMEMTAFVHAVRWTAATGLVDIGEYPGSERSEAVGVTADGSKVLMSLMFAEYDENGEVLSIDQGAAFWTEAGGHQLISTDGIPFFGYNSLHPVDLSADGKRFVAGIAGGGPRQGVLWDEQDGYQIILARPDMGLPIVWPIDLSGDGTTVGGTLYDINYNERRAFLWDEQHGTRLVSEILIDAGVDLGTWTLLDVTGVSHDGSVVVGTGLRNDPDTGFRVRDVWVMTITQDVPVCPGDFDRDGNVNTADITAFLSAWFAARAGGPTNGADFNADGSVNTADITAFLSAWFEARAGGC